MNERPVTGLLSRVTAAARRCAGAAQAPRYVAGTALALTLVALLVVLGIKAERLDIGRQHEVLEHLREIRTIDTRWDMEALRARGDTGFRPVSIDFGPALTRARRALSARAAASAERALRHGWPDLDRRLTEKAALVAQAGKAGEAARQALKTVMAAETEMAGLVRGSWRDFPDRERLVAVENVVTQLLAGVQDYYFSPRAVQRKSIDAALADLRAAAPRLPPALQAGIDRLEGNVRALLKTKTAEEAFFKRIAFHTAGPRLDALTYAIHREMEQQLIRRERYRIYLLACLGALSIFGIYVVLCVVANYRRLSATFLALKAGNEQLEQGAAGSTPEARDEPPLP